MYRSNLYRMCIDVAESIVNYVNQYALAICAVYGRAFIPAAKEAWGLMRSRGFDAVLNDALIGGVLAFAQLVCGLLSGNSTLASILSKRIEAAIRHRREGSK